MFKRIIKKDVKKATKEMFLELLEVFTTAEYSYNPATKELKIKLKKEW